ncbi:MAG: molybdopterin molybdotransferase MoeA, partial [Mycobacteriales bacterium]
MKSVDQHLADCRRLLPARAPVQVPTGEAVGLVLAEDVVATADSPAFATSAMDGYAVRVADVPGDLRVVGEVAAGSVPDAAVSAGAAVRIMTGSPLPEGTEAVVRVEDTEERDGVVTVHTAAAAGQSLRGVGDDVRTGDVVLPAGRRIGSAQLAALLTAGRREVLVHPRPRVAVLSTGDELVAAGTDPGPAQLVDSNGPALAVAAAAAGAEVVHVARASDDPAALVAALDALPDVDLVVTSGGVSMGAYDVVKAALAPLGITFEQVAVQPGKPQAWGRLRGGPAFLGLPGNPVSSLVCFELFGRAVLGAERPVLGARLLDPVERSHAGIRQLRRGR